MDIGANSLFIGLNELHFFILLGLLGYLTGRLSVNSSHEWWLATPDLHLLRLVSLDGRLRRLSIHLGAAFKHLVVVIASELMGLAFLR